MNISDKNNNKVFIPKTEQERWNDEVRDYNVHCWLSQLQEIEDFPLSDLLKWKRRIKNFVSLEESEELLQTFQNYSLTDKNRMKEFIKNGVPIEKALEYASIGIKEENVIFANREKVYNGAEVKMEGNFLRKTFYLGCFAALAAAPAFAITNFLYFSSIQEMQDLHQIRNIFNTAYSFYVEDSFNKALEFLPDIKSIDEKEFAPLAGILFMFGAAYLKDYKKMKKERVDLFSTIIEKQEGNIERWLPSTDEEIRKKYETFLSEGNKFLLKKMTAFELRLFLTGDEETKRELLNYRKPDFDDKLRATALDSKNFFIYICSSVTAAMPEWSKKAIRKIFSLKEEQDYLDFSSSEVLVEKFNKIEALDKSINKPETPEEKIEFIKRKQKLKKELEDLEEKKQFSKTSNKLSAC